MARVTIDGSAVEELKEDMAVGYQRVHNLTFLNMFRQEVPVDTGRLQREHRSEGPPRKRGRYWTLRWIAPTGYDMYVHQGTGDRVATTGNTLRPGGRLRATTLTRTIRGQRANPWLARSFRRLGLLQVRWIRGY